MLSCFRNHKSRKKKEGFFLKNGAAMLEQLVHGFNGNCNPIRMYSVNELSKATSDYKDDDLIHRDWDYKFYKGVHEGQEILVKTFSGRHAPLSNLGRVEFITNEVAIASNMSNHKNILKLIGCCLETKFPTLVFEFPAKGNLTLHIYRENDHLLPWQVKLKIAMEVADAVAYLHHGTSKVIIHQDIRAGHIFLDQDYVAKLSEFQMSVPIPSGETHVDVQTITGAQGCVAPEYAISGRTSEKSDVYKFGVLLLDLLTGTRLGSVFFCSVLSNTGSPSSHNRDYESACRLLLNLCKTYLEDNILEDENKKQVVECAKLVQRCLQANPDERPIMTEVAQLLRMIKSF